MFVEKKLIILLLLYKLFFFFFLSPHPNVEERLLKLDKKLELAGSIGVSVFLGGKNRTIYKKSQ